MQSESYLDLAPSRLVSHVVLGADFRFGLVLEVELDRLYLLVSPAWFVGCVFQGPDLGLCIPDKLFLLYL